MTFGRSKEHLLSALDEQYKLIEKPLGQCVEPVDHHIVIAASAPGDIALGQLLESSPLQQSNTIG